ncbi:hypothetical protein CBR_g36276 [Chara braunii]|uniref:FAS1 domain-containing protein n=1 Tax=Chara braunii TaxID=69332 RepID=A0A388LKE4_CHABU|nr:hypothetical protein CBR_g36276 [Chara braunii]|eukprot:GBG82747.1 hypothetical protein CBR_g36276 [Chara braunii]
MFYNALVASQINLTLIGIVGGGKVTVFEPNNGPIAMLSEKLNLCLDTQCSKIEVLTQILLFHLVVGGNYTAAELTDLSKLTAASGMPSDLVTLGDGTIMVEGPAKQIMLVYDYPSHELNALGVHVDICISKSKREATGYTVSALRMRDADKVAKEAAKPKRKVAKGGTMEKTLIYEPSGAAQSDDEGDGAAPTRPSNLQFSSASSKIFPVEKGFFMDYGEDGKMNTNTYFCTVILDMILDIPAHERGYNHRGLNPLHVEDIESAMERSVLEKFDHSKPIYSKPTLILVPLHNKPTVDPITGQSCRAIRVTPEKFRVDQVDRYYWYPLSGQHNVEAARLFIDRRRDLLTDLRVDYWTARPVHFPDEHEDNYQQLSTYENLKDKMAIPPPQRFIVTAIKQTYKDWGCPQVGLGIAVRGPAKDKKNKYEEFAKAALRQTGSSKNWELSQGTWERKWSGILAPYMVLAKATDDVWEKVMKVYDAWERRDLPGRDGILPRRKIDTVGRTSKAGPGSYEEKDRRIAVNWVPRTGGANHFVAVRDPDVHVWKTITTLGRRERIQALTDLISGFVILSPKTSVKAENAGLQGMDVYVDNIKKDRAMLRLFHYFRWEQSHDDPQQRPPWNDEFFKDLCIILKEFESEGLTWEKWAVNRNKYFKNSNYVDRFPKKLGGENVKAVGETEKLAQECPAGFRNFVERIFDKSKQRGCESIRLSGLAKHIHFKKQNCISVFVPFWFKAHGVPNDEGDAADVQRAMKHFECHVAILDLCHPTPLHIWIDDVFRSVYNFLCDLCGEYWSLVCFFPRSWETTFIQRIRDFDNVHLVISAWARRTQHSVKHPNRVGNMPLGEFDRIFVIMYSNDGDYHQNTINVHELDTTLSNDLVKGGASSSTSFEPPRQMRAFNEKFEEKPFAMTK